MLRRVLLSWMTVGLLLFLTGVTSHAAMLSTLPLQVVGTLEYVNDLSAPHYEVDGHVLLISQVEERVAALVGARVVVIGVEVSAPSIYQRPLLAVSEIRLLEEGSRPAPLKPPVDELPAPVEPPVTLPPPEHSPVLPLPELPLLPGQPIVILPGTPDPIPAKPPGNDPPVILPVTPGPQPPAQTLPITLPGPPFLNGTDRFVLFGRVQSIADRFYLVDPAGDGGVRYWVDSRTIVLTDLQGVVVAAIAAGNAESAEGPYVLESVIPLSEDLVDRITSNQGMIFQMPNRPISVVLKGRPLQLDASPVIGNERTLVSLRTISEALGAHVSWDADTRTATVRLDGREIRFTVGSVRIRLCQGTEETMVFTDVSPVIIHGRLMLPLRSLSELFGLTVGWDGNSYTVRLD